MIGWLHLIAIFSSLVHAMSETLNVGRAAVLVEARKLSHLYGVGDAQTLILHDIDLAILSGQLIALTGPSGSGKTTLLTLLGALRSNQSGTLRVLGHDLDRLPESELLEVRRGIGFIFQMHNLLESLTSIDNVMMAAQLRWDRGEARDRARHILERVGLGERLHYKPSALSGGQRQRVAIARALVTDPGLILADEPTAALDLKASHDIMDLLREQIEINNSSCLIVTHDARVTEQADRVISLVDGRITHDEPIQRIAM